MSQILEMGIVLRQSMKNMFVTYLGFIIGAVNVLFLFTSFLSDRQYGLVSYVLSVSTILTPILTFGVHTTFIKYYWSYSIGKEQNKFVTFMLILPLFMILIAGLITLLLYQHIYEFISKKNEIVGYYIWTIFGLSAIMAYFEVFYAWVRVQFKTVEGNFLKEVFPRVFTTLLLVLVHIKWINFEQFIQALCGVYLLRTLLMILISFQIKKPTILLKIPTNYQSLIWYGLFLILAGSVATFFIDIDKFMLNQYLPLSQIAIYTVAVFIATVISVPNRAVYQLVSPMIAQLLNQNKNQELRLFYKKTTDNVYFVGSIIFLLIVLNAQDIYTLIPSTNYAQGIEVLWLISVVKLLDTLTGTSNAVLLNASYYRIVLYLGIALVTLMIIFNIIFIPKWGIVGAAIATFIAFLLYNLLKIYFVYRNNQLQPFSYEVGKITLFLLLLLGIFSVIPMPFSSVYNLIFRSSIIVLLSVVCGIYFHFSAEIISTTLSILIFLYRKSNGFLKNILYWCINRIKRLQVE